MATRTKKPVKKPSAPLRMEALAERIRVLAKALHEVGARINMASRDRYVAAGGCLSCRGKGRTTQHWHDGDSITETCGTCGGYRAFAHEIIAWEDAERLTAAETAELDAACEPLEAAQGYLDEEEAIRKPRKGHMVRIVKGRKVPTGDYQCFWIGTTNQRYGERAGLKDAAGNTLWTASDNIMGLAECKECGHHGTTDEILFDIDLGLCGGCSDCAKDEGRAAM